MFALHPKWADPYTPLFEHPARSEETMDEGEGGDHSGKPDTAPHDGHRDRPPQVPPITPEPKRK